ncbi:MAG TPA: hypothetical protein VHE80_10860 [Acidimicrobiales bacterium]|nr:hypothetical protein [Acidimicrobiales bacterium]
MDRSELARSADPQAFVPYLRDNPPPVPTGAHEHGPVQTVRRDSYRGHYIVVRTTYEIEVDGRPVRGHLGVGNDGQVHYHALPNYSFDSALDLVRQLIDSFPQRFAAGEHHSQGGE